MKSFVVTILLIFVVLPFAVDAQTPSASGSFPLDIVWGANTYVPAHYPGKALPVRASTLRIVALTPTQNPSNIEFTWSIQDGSSLSQTAELKGRGENVFILRAEDIIPNFTHEIILTARNVSTGTESRTTIRTPLHEPEVRIWQKSGPVINAIPAPAGSTQELRALPFYFIAQALQDLSFEWQAANQRASQSGRPDVLLLNIPQNTPPGIERSVEVEVTNKNNRRQRDRAEVPFITTQ